MSNFHEPTIVDKSTPLYRAITLELERRRQQIGLSMWQVDDAAGTQDGHFAKCLHADRPSGRQAQWSTLALLMGALYPEGFDVTITPKVGQCLTPEQHKLKVNFAAADNCPRTRRRLMAELGSKGGIARREKLMAMTQKERQQIAKKAAKTRRKNKLLRAQVSRSQASL